MTFRLQSGLPDTLSIYYLSGMESVDHFPVLAAVTGILVQLLLNGTSKR